MTYSNGGDIFGYTPSLAMAYFAGVLFSISALMHIFQYFKLRSHYLYLFMAGVLSMPISFYSLVLTTCQWKLGHTGFESVLPLVTQSELVRLL